MADLFGQILIENHVILKTDLDRCLKIQRDLKGTKPLGKILVEKGFLNPSVLKSILSIQQRRRKPSEEIKTKIRGEHVASRIREKNIQGLLELVKNAGGTDLYLIAGSKPSARINGTLVELEHPPLSSNEIQDAVAQTVDGAEYHSIFHQREFVSSFNLRSGGRCRINVCNDFKGICAIYHVFPDDVKTLEELGFPPIILAMAGMNRGLILITGPKSSGKSTTLAAFVDHINAGYRKHIITVEDPIQVVHRNKKSIINQRQVGSETDSYLCGLKSAIYQDADVIFISELDGVETIQTAVETSEAGSLVIATLPTPNAVQTIYRIVDSFPENLQPRIRGLLASSLKAVISQELLPDPKGDKMSIVKEILVVNSTVASFIRDNKIGQIPSIIQTGRRDGMVAMDDSLYELVSKNRITGEDAYAHALNKTRFERFLSD